MKWSKNKQSPNYQIKMKMKKKKLKKIKTKVAKCFRIIKLTNYNKIITSKSNWIK